MFCSTSTTLNPFTAFSYGDPSPYINILDHEPNPNSFHLHHHHNPNITINPPVSDSNLLTPAPSSNNVMSTKQDIQVTYGDHHHHHHHYQYGYGTSSVFLAEKRPVKKDRHSKIYTAQGLRDRRVRLSIEIARKFFDLQDMLGFDKASKTLEWLLTKSRKAIKELAQDNDNNHSGGAKSFSSNSTCEEVESENGILNGKRTKKLKKKAVALSSLKLAAAKELRERARARARERTRVKLLCTTTFNQYSKINPDPTFDQTLNQSKPSSSLNHHQQSSSSASYSSTSFKVIAHNQAEVPNNNIIEESIVIKRKLKPSSMVGTYQQSLLMLKDANCHINNSNSNNLPNLPPNWDLNNAIARSSLCAITNMNRSTGLHLYGKLWEAETVNAYTNYDPWEMKM